MSKIAVLNSSGKEVDHLELDLMIESSDINTQVVHDVVIGYLANQRMGNASTKSRGEVQATTKKPWRQKGTGRARIGTVTSPVWRGGGIAFGPKPRDHRQNITSKMRKSALKNVFADKLSNGNVIVIDKIYCEEPKTKTIVALLNNLNLAGVKTLILTADYNYNVVKSASNIPGVSVMFVKDCHTYACINNNKILIEKDAVQSIKDRLI